MALKRMSTRGKRVARQFDKLPPKQQENMGQRTKAIAGKYGARSRSAVSASDLDTIQENIDMAKQTGEGVKSRRRR